MARHKINEYSLKILRDFLSKEEKSLMYWKYVIEKDTTDELLMRQANGNIPSNIERIEDLKRSIELINTTIS